MSDSSLTVGTLTAKLDLDTAGLTAGLAKTDAKMTETAAHGEAAGKRMSAAFKQFGSELGELAIAEFAKQSVEAFSEAEQATVKLNDAFARFPALAGASASEMHEYNEELSKNSRYTVAALDSGAAILARFGLTAEQLKSDMPILANYAAYTGQTIPAAAEALGKATLGATRPLKNIGVTFKATHDVAKDTATVFSLVGTAVNGYAQKDLGTAAGKMANFNKQLDEMKVAIGSVLVPILEAVAVPLAKIASGAQAAAEGFAKLPGPVKDTALALAAIVALGKVGLFTNLTRGMAGFGTSLRLFQLMHTQTEANIQGVSRLSLFAKSAGQGMKSFGSAISGAFGGPLGLALAGVTIAVGLWANANANAKEQVAEHKQAVDELADSMNKVSGAATAATAKQLIDLLGPADGAFKAVGSSAGDMAAAIVSGEPAVDRMRVTLEKLDQGAAATKINTSSLGDAIQRWAKDAGVSFSNMASAALEGGQAQAAMADKVRAAGGDVNVFNGQMGSYRKAFEDAYPGMEALRDVNDKFGEGVKQTAEEFENLATAAGKKINFDPGALITGLKAADAANKTVEDGLSALGIKGPRAAAVIATLGDAVGPTVDGVTLFADHMVDAGSAAEGATPGLEGAAGATKAVGDAATAATDPAKAIKDQLDNITTASSNADDSATLLQATLDRLAGRSQARIDGLRAEATSLRGIGTAARDVAAAQLDVADKQQAVKDAEKGVDLHDQAHNTLALANAEQKLADARKKPLTKSFDNADKINAVAKATQAVADAQKRVDNPDTVAKANKLKQAKLDLADAESTLKDKQDGVAEADETATKAMIANANAVAVSARAHHGIAAAADAGAASMLKSRDAFIKAKEAAGLSADAANKLADSYGLIPSQVSTAIIANDTASPVITSVHTLLLSLPTELQVSISGDSTALRQQITLAIDAIQNMTLTPGYGEVGGTASTGYKVAAPAPAATNATTGRAKPQALGGEISGGVAGIDSVPLLGMPGEHMLTTDDVGRLGGQAGVYRFRRALAAGAVGRYASGGGVPSGGALAGNAAYQPGDREGNVRSSLDTLSGAVADFAAAAADARAASADAASALRDAKGSQASTRGDQASKVHDVQVSNAAKLTAAEQSLAAARSKATKAAADAATRNAAAIAKAEAAVTAAQARSHKTAAQSATRTAAITKAENALTAARARGTSGGASAAVLKAEEHLTATRTANAQALGKATAAQHKANAAEAAKVASAQRAATVDARAAQIATRRAAAEAATQRAEAGMRSELVTLGRQYDANSAKLGTLTDKLADLQSKAADVTSSIQSNVTGIGGGILGSQDFQGSSTTAGDILKSLQQNADTAKGFDANIAKLVSLGLNPQAAEQVAEADPTGRGGVVAQALAGATKAQVAQINALLAQQASLGATTGGRVAGAEYGAQISATNLQISATNLQLRVEAAEAARIGNTIAAATRAAMTGQKVTITVGAKELNGVISAVVRTETSAAVRKAAGYR